MWVMTTAGFFSVVQHRDDPDKVMIRARCEEDINALAELIPGAQPVNTPNADYTWRITVSAAEWVHALTTIALDVDYPNFKSAVKSPKHKAAYTRVWGVMYDALDDRLPPPSGGGWMEEESWLTDTATDTDGEQTPISFIGDREHERTVPFFLGPDEAA